MATDSAAKSMTNTFTGTTADRLTFTQLWPAVEVFNHDGSNNMFVVCDGSATPTAVADANDATVIPPLTSKVIRVSPAASAFTTVVISVVGSGGKYTAEGVQ